MRVFCDKALKVESRIIFSTMIGLGKYDGE